MAATITNAPAEVILSGLTMRGIVARVTAAVVTARVRAQARRDYRRLLDDEALLRDIGVSRPDVHKALAGVGGWA